MKWMRGGSGSLGFIQATEGGGIAENWPMELLVVGFSAPKMLPWPQEVAR